MKTTIIALSAAGLMLTSLVCAAESDKPVGWYAGAGANIYTFDKLSDHRFNNDSFKVTHPYVSAGYKFGMLRADGMYSYAHSSKNWGKATANTFGLNGYLDFDNSTIFSPYVGVGVERTYYKVNFNGQNQWKDHDNTVTGTVGTRAYLTQHLALDVAYKADIEHLSKNGGVKLGLAYQFD